MLTGKAKEDFYYYVFNNIKEQLFGDLQDVYDYIYSLPISCKNALIIEWFDSVGIHILFDYWHNEEAWFSNIYHSKNMNMCINIKNQSRQEASKQAIIKANEIYNESKN